MLFLDVARPRSSSALRVRSSSAASLASACEHLGRRSEAEHLYRDTLSRRRRTTKPDSPLLAGDLAARTVLTPHAGAHTVEAVDAMGRGAVDAVLAVLDGRTPPNLVPVPQEAA